MENLWNNTCVLISKTGEVILSDPTLRGHNQAISNCASQMGIEISSEQSMVKMLESLTKMNHTILLNCGKIADKDGIPRRTGYLALPSTFNLEQLEKIEMLKMLLEEYQSITAWKLEDNNLKTMSMGNSNQVISIIQNMIQNTIQNTSDINKDISK